MRRKKYIIDSAAVLNNFNFQFEKEREYFTTAEIINEFKDLRSRSIINNALQNSLLKILEPSEDSIKKIKGKTEGIGLKLSNADISLVALASEFKKKRKNVEVITDDYSVQNILLKLKIPFTSVLRGEIKKFKKFPKRNLKKFS